MNLSTIEITRDTRKNLLWHFIFLIGCYSFAMIIYGKGGIPFIISLTGGVLSWNEWLFPSILGWIGIVFILFVLLKKEYKYVFVSLIFATFCIFSSWLLFARYSDNFLFTIFTSIPFIFSLVIWALKLNGLITIKNHVK